MKTLENSFKELVSHMNPTETQWRNMISLVIGNSNCYCEKCTKMSKFYYGQEFGEWHSTDKKGSPIVEYRRERK